MRRALVLAILATLVLAYPALAIHRRARMSQPTQPTLQSGIDKTGFDTSVRPQDNFFRAINGKWVDKTEIPADRSFWGSFVALANEADENLHRIVTACADAKNNPPGSIQQKIGDMYTSYMDEARVEQLGITPIADLLASIDGIKTKQDLIRVSAELEKDGVGAALGIHIGSDAKNSDQYAIYLSQTGLGLPDRDYYWDAKFAKTLDAYRSHIEKMLTLAKVPNPKQAAAEIVTLETALAKAQWSKMDNRDDTKTYNKKNRGELDKLAPAFDWNLYFNTLGLKNVQDVVVSQPSYVTTVAGMFDSVPLGTWKAWLKWNTLARYASLLNHDIADESFAFYGTTLRGIPQNRPRWKRGVGAVEGTLGHGLGKLYVEKHFPPEAKAKMDKMVANVIQAYRVAFEKNEWMSPETKQKALKKLSTFRPKIGYPNKWRDYSALEIRRDDLIGNIRRANAFEWNRALAKLGKPVDRDEWFMTPQTVNAYYNSTWNEILFPAAILQPPFFNKDADDAVNYGAIGAVIGHEIGHGFDDQGSKSDEKGNLANWWTPADRAEFDKRGAALAAQYDRFEPLPGFKVNGRYTLGESIGDLSGVTISHAAYRASLNGQKAPVIDGLTGDQRFFIGFAQIWRFKYREDELKQRLVIDPHPPAECRANGTTQNVDAFYEAFDIKPSDKMYLPPEQRVKIW